jgi:hypothetical protein
VLDAAAGGGAASDPGFLDRTPAVTRATIRARMCNRRRPVRPATVYAIAPGNTRSHRCVDQPDGGRHCDTAKIGPCRRARRDSGAMLARSHEDAAKVCDHWQEKLFDSFIDAKGRILSAKACKFDGIYFRRTREIQGQSPRGAARCETAC